MQNDQLEKGFTLIEMLVVLVIITLLATLVGPQLFKKVGSSQVKVAAVQVEMISSALDTYRLDIGSYPTTEQGLGALNKKPNAVTAWDGPYLAKALPMDPWGNPYFYKKPGKDGAFALYSFGKDGVKGGEGEGKDIGVF